MTINMLKEMNENMSKQLNEERKLTYNMKMEGKIQMKHQIEMLEMKKISESNKEFG